MKINNNIAALNTLISFARADKKIAKSSARLSSGLRISSSKDDPAGMAIANKMDSHIKRIDMSNRNALDGISLIQTAEGALNEVNNILQRMRELAVQSANEVLEPEDREKIQYEIDSLKTEVNELAFKTEFNGIKILGGAASRLAFGSNDDVAKISYVSDNMNPGNIRYTITGVGVPAKVTTVYPLSTGVEGTIKINDYPINILATDTSDEILNKLIYAGNMNGVNVLVNDPEINLISKESGSSQQVRISMSNPVLANSLGLTEGIVKGVDAIIEDVVYYDPQGNLDTSFNNTSVIKADGNRVTVSSDNGKKVSIDLQFVVSKEANFFLNDGTSVSDAGVITGTIPMGGSIKEFGPLILQVGPDKDMEMEVIIPEVTSTSIGIDDLNFLSVIGATHGITALDSAINDISSIRAKLGAYQNRLEFTNNSLDVSYENAMTALSRIRDTDMAREMTAYTQQMVISQAAMSILSQANQRPEQILQLL